MVPRNFTEVLLGCFESMPQWSLEICNINIDQLTIDSFKIIIIIIPANYKSTTHI